MISNASSVKKNEDVPMFWIEFKYPTRKYLIVPIPEKQTKKHLIDEIMDKSIELMFDLSVHHYISNVKRLNATLEVRFKECRGGRKPNFGIRTVRKIAKIIEKGSVPTVPF